MARFNLKSILVAGTISAAAVMGLVSKWEGVSYKAYRDIAGVTTICYGDTYNVHMGMVETPKNCEKRLLNQLAIHEKEMLSCLKVQPPWKVHVAALSLTYNIGGTAFCSTKNSVKNAMNESRWVDACNNLMKYNKAKVRGVMTTIKGLNNRRTEERKICLEGAKDKAPVEEKKGYASELVSMASKLFAD